MGQPFLYHKTFFMPFSAHAGRNSLVSPSHNGKATVKLLSQFARVAGPTIFYKSNKDYQEA